jgi:hypothetical protein
VDEAESIRIEFKKTDCTLQEVCMGRVFDVGFGGLALDEVFRVEETQVD